MTSPSSEFDVYYAALLDRDPAYEGRIYVGVVSTGIFCRLTCPARKPKSENCRFLESTGACLEAGFRPCKRCRPLDAADELEPALAQLVDLIERDPSRRWSERDLAAMGFDPSTVRRGFKRHFGMTFLQLARLRRLRRGSKVLADGGRVIDAQLEAGFESGSGFRASFTRVLGQSPASLKIP